MQQLAQLVVRALAPLLGAVLVAMATSVVADTPEGQTFPVLTAVPGSLDFGSVVAGGSPVCQIVVGTNTGGSSLLFENLFLEGPDFQIDSSNCIDAILIPGESCSTTVCFGPAPGALGLFSDELLFIGNFDDVAVPLSGLAVTKQGFSQILVSPSSIGFGERPVGAPASCQNVLISNTSPEISLQSLNVSISGSPDFFLGADACSGPGLPAGGSCQVSACFQPSVAGISVAQLLVTSLEDEASATLIGSGVVVEPPIQLLMSPSPADFGDRLVGTSATISVTLTAQLSGPTGGVTLDGLDLEGDSSFTRVGGSCQPGQSLSVSEPSCTILVRFAPSDIGALAAVLTATTTQGISAEAALTGNGVGLDQERLDPLIVFRGTTRQEWVGSSMDFLRGLGGANDLGFLFGAPAGAADDQGAAWLIADILIGLGAFAIQPPLLADIAAADGRFGVRILPEAALLNGCHFGTQGFGWSVAGIDRSHGLSETALIAIGAPGWSGGSNLGQIGSRGAVFLLAGPTPAEQGSVPVSAWLTPDADGHRRGIRIVDSRSGGPCLGSGLRALGRIDGSARPALAFQDLPMTIDSATARQSTYILHQPETLINGADIDVSTGHPNLIRVAVPFNEGAYLPTMSTVAPLGDFNGNGFDDFAIAAPNARFFSIDTGSWHAGAVFVMFGAEQALPTELLVPTQLSAETLGERVLTLLGPRIPDQALDGLIGTELPRFGVSIDGAGDFNGNGLADLIIGIGESAQQPGSALVLYGGQHVSPLFADALDESQALRLTSSNSADQGFAESVRGVGDISGNGLDDILLGVPWADLTAYDGVAASDAGRVYLIHGTGIDMTSGQTALDVAAPSQRVRRYTLGNELPGELLSESRFGLVLAAPASDLTGNGNPDFAVAAPRGLAANSEAAGGWAIIIEGEAEPSSLALAALPAGSPIFPDQRVLQLAVSNTGQARVNNLELSLVLSNPERLINTALTQAQTCSLDQAGALRCADLSERLWDCQLSPGEASCRLRRLAAEQTVVLLFALDGEAPESLSAEVSAANAAAVQLQFEANQ